MQNKQRRYTVRVEPEEGTDWYLYTFLAQGGNVVLSLRFPEPDVDCTDDMIDAARAVMSAIVHGVGRVMLDMEG